MYVLFAYNSFVGRYEGYYAHKFVVEVKDPRPPHGWHIVSTKMEHDTEVLKCKE